jgi:hypothetical protein
MFFSEEKNQKTFTSSPASTYGTWPDRWRSARNESLLVLFFRKEHASLYFSLSAQLWPRSSADPAA